MDCINVAVVEQGGIELRGLFGVAIEPQAWGYARHVNFAPNRRAAWGAWRLALSYHCGDRPRACGRRERQKARTLGRCRNSKTKPAQRTRVPPHLVALYRRSLLSAARTCRCSDECGCETSCRTCHHRLPSAVVPRLPTKSSDWADSGRSAVCGNSSSCPTAAIQRRHRGGSKPCLTERRLDLPRQ